MSDTLDPARWPVIVQVVAGLAAGAVSAVLWVFGARRRRAINDEDDQKLREELIGHRLREDLQKILEANRISMNAALEANRSSLNFVLEDHKREVREQIAAIDDRQRDLELTVARLPQGRQR